MEFPKPLARLLNANDLTEQIIRKGYPYLKMWEGILDAARKSVKEKLVEIGRPIDLTETTKLVLSTYKQERFSKPENASPETLAELKRLGCFKMIEITSMIERTRG